LDAAPGWLWMACCPGLQLANLVAGKGRTKTDRQTAASGAPATGAVPPTRMASSVSRPRLPSSGPMSSPAVAGAFSWPSGSGGAAPACSSNSE
jgi:hypothetical protein